MSLDSIVRQASMSELSSLGSVVHKILEITADKNSTANDLKEAIEIDPPLSSKVLRLANSAYYGITRKISSIQEAITFIGFGTVKELSLSVKVSQVFEDDKVTHGYSRKKLWEHSVGVALISKNIYRRIFRETGDMIYSAGLLHELGIIVEDQYLHKQFEKVLKNAQTEGMPLTKAEANEFGFDHTMVGRDLTHAWKFPDELIAAVTYHHRPLFVEPRYMRQAYTLFIADYLCMLNEIGYSDMQGNKDNKLLYKKCCSALKIDPIALEVILEDTTEELNQMKQAGALLYA